VEPQHQGEIPIPVTKARHPYAGSTAVATTAICSITKPDAASVARGKGYCSSSTKKSRLYSKGVPLAGKKWTRGPERNSKLSLSEGGEVSPHQDKNRGETSPDC